MKKPVLLLFSLKDKPSAVLLNSQAVRGWVFNELNKSITIKNTAGKN